MPWRLERVTSEQGLPAVLELQRGSFVNPWSAEALQWELDHSPVSRLYTLSGEDGVAVAFCACWHLVDELHINSLAVAPAKRQQGIAAELVRRVLRQAREEGATRATLEVRRSNEAARALYARLGFEVEAIRPDYYTSPREDALILWRRDLQDV